jgi:hypothetical protein
MPYPNFASAKSFADFLGSRYVKNDIIADGLTALHGLQHSLSLLLSCRMFAPPISIALKPPIPFARSLQP